MSTWWRRASTWRIRMGKLADSSLGARFLGMNPWVMVAAPDYLKTARHAEAARRT